MGIAGHDTGRAAAQESMHGVALNGGGKQMAGLVRHLTATQAAKMAAGRQRQALRAGRILLYRDHIPYVSFLVLEGAVGFELGRGTRLARSVTMSGPLVIGEHHVAHRHPFPMTVRALDNVVMCVVCCPPVAEIAASGRRIVKRAPVKN